MTVVVGGSARKVGKTRAVCDIIRATTELRWTAVKLTSHQHSQQHGDRATDTERYLEAGAIRSFLLHAAAELPEADHLIVESNAVLEHLRPDLFVFVTVADSDWKPSALQVYAQADIVVERVIPPDTLREIARQLLQTKL